MNAPIDRIMQIILAEANKLETDAGYSGSFGDGGAGILRQQVRFYMAGMNGQLPQEWQKYQEQAVQAELEQDPTYKAMKQQEEALRQKYGLKGTMNRLEGPKA